MDQSEMFDLPTAEIQRRMAKEKPSTRLYGERDPNLTCTACWTSWGVHTDREWLMGCEQWKK